MPFPGVALQSKGTAYIFDIYAMIVFDNLIFSLQRAGGISSMWSILIKQMLDSPQASVVRFLEYPDAKQNIFRKEIDIPDNLILHRNSYLPTKMELLRPVKLNQKKKFIFHSPYYRYCSNPYAINIATIHDFIYERIPEAGNRFSALQRYIKRRAIKHADYIVCVSHNTQTDLMDIFDNISTERSCVIHNAVDPRFRPSETLKQSVKDSIVFVGSRNRYKNFDIAIKAAHISGMRLLICGSHLNKKEICRLNESRISWDTVISPDIDTLNRIYNEAFMLIYPSEYEGFGIPVIEAQAAGCPVVAMNKSSIPEISGNPPATLLIKSSSSEELSEAINILRNETERDKIIRNGLNNASGFAPEIMSSKYSELYNKILNAC